MAKRYTKKYKSKKHLRKGRKTRKNKYGGDPNQEIIDSQARKNRFRNNFKDYIIQITNRKNINKAVNSIITSFNNNNGMINTLIPVSVAGKPLDIKTTKTQVVDFVSPITVIFDNATGIVSDEQLIRLLNAYFTNGGNFNNLSSRVKITPFENEVNKRRINNVKILLDKSNPFHIIEDGLSEETRTKLAELIPNEQQIVSEPELEPEPEHTAPEPAPVPETALPKLSLPYPLPEDNKTGYDRSVAPEFWKPIFDNGEELMLLRETFMTIYESDKYTSDTSKRFIICDLLEKLFPGYLTKYTLGYKESPKTLVTVNVMNCFITLLYGIITYRLFDNKEDYLILFKGGRALQLSLNDIPNVTKYFSEDTDVLIIPNKFHGGVYNLEKMKNLSCHIAYLVKWFIPPEVNIVISLPTLSSKDITKILYNDDKLYKPLSDVGFGEIKEDIRKYFENPLYFPFYLDTFETITLFITPTLDDILDEKMYYYSKYSNAKNKLKKGEMITERGYEGLTADECDFYMFKFSRSIKQLVNSVIKRDYASLDIVDNDDNSKVLLPETIPDFGKYPKKERNAIYNKVNETSRLILRGIISKFDDYSNDEKERILEELYP
jgi:hypothetical protein